MRILCVDDDAFVREALYFRGLSKVLEHDSIVCVASGEEAVDKVNEESFDVVISDLKMPGISGLEVLRYVKESGVATEVIIVTGVASIASAVEAVRLGARDYIEKPISLDLLVEKIENIRDYRKRLDEAEEFRLAKEACEVEAGRELHRLEFANQKMRKAIKAALARMQDQHQQESGSLCAEVIEMLEPALLDEE